MERVPLWIAPFCPWRLVNGGGERGVEQRERLDWVPLRSLPALSLRFCIGKCMERMETAAQHSSPAHPLPRAPGAYHPCRPPRLPHGACRPPAWSPQHPAEQPAVPEADPHSQPASHREDTAVRSRRGTSFLSRRAQSTPRLHRAFHLPLKVYYNPMWTCPTPAVQATTPAATGPPSHPADPQERPCHLQRAISQRGRARGAVRSLSRSFRGSPHIAQWLNSFFAVPLSVASQLDTSLRKGGGRQSTPDS